MPSAPAYLQNFQSVIDAFGYWPSFHDSPIRRFQVDDDMIELEIEAWEMTDEVDTRGYIKQIKRHIIGFRFRDIASTDLEQFIPQNILFELGFSSNEEQKIQGSFTVVLNSAMGSDLCGQFTAKVGVVTFVRPSGSTTKHEGEQVGTPTPDPPEFQSP